jgi:hypothetical protein
MKRLLFTLLLCTGMALGTKAEENPLNKGVGFGFQLNQYQKDFGFGLNLTSPHFAHDQVAVRMRGNLMYYEQLKDNEYTWTPYTNLTLGLIGVGGYVSENIRLYGEGGVIGIFPSEDFSTQNLAIGGYGLFGFEFFMANSTNYFIEIGSVGKGDTADKLPGKPIYSNGLTVSTGFRIFLKKG